VVAAALDLGMRGQAPVQDEEQARLPNRREWEFNLVVVMMAFGRPKCSYAEKAVINTTTNGLFPPFDTKEPI